MQRFSITMHQRKKNTTFTRIFFHSWFFALARMMTLTTAVIASYLWWRHGGWVSNDGRRDKSRWGLIGIHSHFPIMKREIRPNKSTVIGMKHGGGRTCKMREESGSWVRHSAGDHVVVWSRLSTWRQRKCRKRRRRWRSLCRRRHHVALKIISFFS